MALALVPETSARPRFRCIACSDVHEVSELDRHASVGGRICQECVTHNSRAVIRIVDNYGLNAHQAQNVVDARGIGARAFLNGIVTKLGGSIDTGSNRNIPWLIEVRSERAMIEMQPERSAAPKRVGRSGHPAVSGAALTLDQYRGMSDGERRQLLAREYGSIAR